MIINKNLIKYKNEIINEYKNGLTIDKLSFKYTIASSALHNLLKKNNVKIRNPHDYRIYQSKDKYFNKIDKEEKAYILGFLCADGWINKNLKTFGINLCSRDKEILEKISKEIFDGNPSPIKSIKANKRCGRNNKEQSLLVINNKKIILDLINLGCTPAKSFTLKFPTSEQVPKYLMSHFIRGYFDGDGSIYVNKSKSISLSIVSSEYFIEGFKNMLNNLDIKHFEEIINKKNTTVIRIIGNFQALKFLNFIYQKSPKLKLERKWKKFIDCLDLIKNNKMWNITKEVYKKSIEIIDNKI